MIHSLTYWNQHLSVKLKLWDWGIKKKFLMSFLNGALCLQHRVFCFPGCWKLCSGLGPSLLIDYSHLTSFLLEPQCCGLNSISSQKQGGVWGWFPPPSFKLTNLTWTWFLNSDLWGNSSKHCLFPPPPTCFLFKTISALKIDALLFFVMCPPFL